MKKVVITMNADLHKNLKSMAALEGKPMAVLAREAIEYVIEKLRSTVQAQ